MSEPEWTEERMTVCPTCGAPTSRLEGGSDDSYAWETCVGYFSPPGHDHDDNCRTKGAACANGHRWTMSKRRRCPACDWVGKDECFCHPGKKVDDWPQVS